MTVFRRCILLALLVLGLAPGAEAARRQADEDAVTARAKIHLESGVAYFNEGKFADAEREMSQAYALRPVPELVYNLAQCQERIGASDRAAASYREYLKGRPRAADRADVEKRIAQLEEQARAQAAAAQAPPKDEPPPSGAAQAGAPAAELVSPAPASAPPPEKVVFKEIIVYKDKPPKAGRTLRMISGSLLGLVAVGLAASITFTITAAQAKDEVDKARDVLNKFFSDQSQNSMVNLQSDCMSSPQNVAMGVMGALQGAPPEKLMALADGLCAANRAAQESVKFNNGAAGLSYGLTLLSGAGALTTFLYARHLDKKQEQELAQKARLPNLSLAPTAGPTFGGLALVGEF